MFCVVCACVAGVNKIRLKVTDVSAGSRGLSTSHAARLHEASSGHCRGKVKRSGTFDRGDWVMSEVINASEYTNQ